MRCTVLFSMLCATAFAQYPAGANALRWDGTTSAAGPFCWGFSCTPLVATVTAGESGTLMVRAEFGQPYLLAVSRGASRCLTLSGIYNSLVLDDPIFLLTSGSCSLGSPILSCPGGQDFLPLTFPVGLPSGFSVAIQGLTGVPSGLGFPSASFTQTLIFQVL